MRRLTYKKSKPPVGTGGFDLILGYMKSTHPCKFKVTKPKTEEKRVPHN